MVDYLNDELGDLKRGGGRKGEGGGTRKWVKTGSEWGEG